MYSIYDDTDGMVSLRKFKFKWKWEVKNIFGKIILKIVSNYTFFKGFVSLKKELITDFLKQY